MPAAAMKLRRVATRENEERPSLAHRADLEVARASSAAKEMLEQVRGNMAPPDDARAQEAGAAADRPTRRSMDTSNGAAPRCGPPRRAAARPPLAQPRCAWRSWARQTTRPHPASRRRHGVSHGRSTLLLRDMRMLPAAAAAAAAAVRCCGCCCCCGCCRRCCCCGCCCCGCCCCGCCRRCCCCGCCCCGCCCCCCGCCCCCCGCCSCCCSGGGCGCGSC